VHVALRFKQKYFTPLVCEVCGQEGGLSFLFRARRAETEIYLCPSCTHATIHSLERPE